MSTLSLEVTRLGLRHFCASGKLRDRVSAKHSTEVGFRSLLCHKIRAPPVSTCWSSAQGLALTREK